LDNILLGIEPNEQNIENAWRALRKVGLEGKVREMNSSIEARIGKRADGFSGGEIQRLGVARALVLNPEILILDESTSSLDAISEKRIANLYSSLKSKTTVIVVAHRLSTITKADEIIYIDQGKISTRGNYGELRRKFPKFEEQVQALDVNKE
jgi:ABC-type multidrug transport system fused ATPase/permease subunit